MKTKVLFVASGSKDGQPGSVVRNQAASLSNTGVDLDLFLITGRGFFGYMHSLLPLIRSLRHGRYNVVHSHYSLSAFVTTLALWFLHRIPHVVSLMGSDTRLRGVFALAVRCCSRWWWDKTIVKSEQMQYDARLKRALVIPNGVDMEKVRSVENILPQEPLPYKNNKRQTVLFAADPSREAKHYPLAAAAMKEVSADLRVVYDLPHEEVLRELFSTDVLLSTSLWEGSPNLIKEAMACGCPAVSTPVGDVAWLFGDVPGYFLSTFEAADVAEKVAAALAFAAEHPRTGGRQRIMALGLDGATVARRIIAVYEAVMAARKKKPQKPS